MERVLNYIKCPHDTHDISRGNFSYLKGHNRDVVLEVIRGFNPETWSSARSSTYTHS
jgi:hypothetical protein